MVGDPDAQGAALETIVITSALAERPARAANYAGESDGLQRLAQLLADNPNALLQRLLELAREFCAADSAGVALLEQAADRAAECRWVAVSGRLAPHLGSVKPRDFSPCGLCLDRGSPQLFDRPARYYDHLAPLEICEALVVEFHHGGEQLGTLWIASHAPDRHFDREDARTLANLASFCAAALCVQRLRAQAEAVNDAKDRLLLKVAHEMKQPVHAIVGWVEMLRRGVLEASTLPTAYEAIEQNARTQDQLLSDLLDLSRLSEGALRVELQPVDVCAVVERLVQNLVPLSLARRVTVKCELHRPVRFAMADAKRVRQILSNLVLNAIKFTPENGNVTITVREADDWVQIVVNDTGVGVSPEFLHAMFDPFQQGDTRVTGRERGVGIGLTIVRELVEACGGSVRAESDGLGYGTKMIVQLPICDVLASDLLSPSC
jgi:signal transduction histidine kinase